MPTPDPCVFLTGKLKDACEQAQQSTQGGTSGSPGGVLGSLFGSPGSEWWRHAVLRVVEVVIGVSIVIVGVRGLMRSSETVKVVVQGSKKVGSKL